MRPRPIVSMAPLIAMAKPSGVSRGTTQRPMMSIVSERQWRSRISFHSFQSASNCTRPCCIRTPLKSFLGSKRCRLMSELIGIFWVSLGLVENAGLEAEAQIFFKAHPHVAFALRLKKIVKCTHFRFVVGAGTDLFGCSNAQLAISGIRVAERSESRHQPWNDGIANSLPFRVANSARAGLLNSRFNLFRNLEIRLATIATRDARFERQP